jgi:hypothetical protein
MKAILIVFIIFCLNLNMLAQRQKAENYFEKHIRLSVGKETMLALPRLDFNIDFIFKIDKDIIFPVYNRF